MSTRDFHFMDQVAKYIFKFIIQVFLGLEADSPSPVTAVRGGFSMLHDDISADCTLLLH